MFRDLIPAATRRRFSDRLAWRDQDGERGAILVIAAIATVLALSCTAFAVDLGKGVSTKRNLQEAVDNAAIDGVLALGDRFGQAPGLTPQQHATKLAADSLKTNGYDTLDPTAVTSFTVTLGKMDTTTNTFVAGAVPNDSVQVRATISRTRYFVPGSSPYYATGTSSVRTVGGIAIGSWLARVNSTGLLNSLIGGLLGNGVTLAGYTGLAAAAVNLGELRDQFGMASVGALLANPMKVKDMLTKSAAALQKRGDAASLLAMVDLQTLAAATNALLTFLPGDLIKICPGTGSVADAADINTMALVQMAIQTAIGTNPIAVTVAPSSLGGLGGLLNAGGNAVTIKILDPPQIAIGPPGPVNGICPTKATTAQIRAQIHLRPLGTILGNLIDLPIAIDVASAEATLTGVTCANPVANSTATVATNTSLVRARIGNLSDINAVNPTVSPGTILGLITISADVSVGGAGNQTLNFGPGSPAGPFGWNKTKSVGGTSLGLANLLNGNLHLGLLGLDLLGIVTGLVGALLHPVLVLLDSLTDPLLALLGVSLGGADATVWRLNCNQRSLSN
jgi:uncharacterized membrane protein